MKTVLLASASGKSSTTMIVEDDRSESRDSCYFPGCRKDANCKCEICLASINATLDLMPTSYQKSTLTNIPASRPNREVERTPISFNSSNLSTPSSSPIRVPVSPVSISSTRLNLEQKMENNKGKWRLGGCYFRLLLVLSLIFSAHFGSSWVVSGLLRPVLSADIVRNLGERSWVVKDLRGRLRFVQRELQGLVDGEISNCSNANSNWEIDQDGLLLSSRCTLYKTATEEVGIWGWPLQTAGLLTAGFSSRSFTILSGRVTEWSDGSVGFLIRKGNTSWVQKMLDASVVQLNPETWVLEYRRSLILDNSRLFSGGVEFLKHRISRMVGRLKQEFWLFPAWENYRFSEFTAEFDRKIPT